MRFFIYGILITFTCLAFVNRYTYANTVQAQTTVNGKVKYYGQTPEDKLRILTESGGSYGC